MGTSPSARTKVHTSVAFGRHQFRPVLTALLLAVSLFGSSSAAASAAMIVQLVLNNSFDNDNTGNVAAGDQLFYTTTPTNTGTVPLTNVQVNNSVGALGSNCPLLAVSATCVLTNSYVVQPLDATEKVGMDQSALARSGWFATSIDFAAQDDSGEIANRGE